MYRILTTASALALAAALPAAAQDTQAASTTPVQEAPPELGPSAPQPVDPAVTPEAPVAAQPAPVDPVAAPAPVDPAAAPAPVDPAATPAAPQPVAAAAPTKEQQVAQIVDAEFPSYDGDGDGNLTKAEFAKWIIAMRDAAQTQGAELPALDKAAKDKWASAAFTNADTDKSRKISKVEMSSFLLG